MLRTPAALLLSTAAAASAQTDPAPFDLVIRGGTVFDGTGSPGRIADVGIIGDRVIEVGDLSRRRGRTERGARGRYVTPGFISIHDHSSTEAMARPVNLLTQGITTAIGNPDGGGPLDLPAQLAVPMGLNYGAYIGFNSVWREVVGLENRRATSAETARMRSLVEGGMRAGAFGLSAGLDYKPGFWATADEVAAVAAAATAWRTNFTNHERVHAGNGYSSIAGMTETVAIGTRAGLMPIITHMKMQGREQGRVAAGLALATDTARRGVAVGMDAYPYTFGSTSLEQLTIPAWAQEGGTDAMLARFRDPALRPRIVAETQAQIDIRWGGAGGIYLSEMRRELSEVVAEMRVTPAEAVLRLLERGQRRVLLRFGAEADQERIVAHPLTAVSCDCGATTSTTGHPRNWGAYPRFLGRYVRQRELVGWGEAVRKMTALPAATIGLAERGYLLPGMIADVTVFDPATVIDRATIERPTLPSTGIETVVVNGRLALDAGRPTGLAVGVPLRRSRHEPSRPMMGGARGLTVRATMPDGARITVRLTQPSGAARPTGTFAVTGLPGGAFTLSPAILQTTTGWASVTGVARWADGRRAAMTLLAEQADPQAGGRATLALLVDGRPVFDAPPASGTVRVARPARRP